MLPQVDWIWQGGRPGDEQQTEAGMGRALESTALRKLQEAAQEYPHLLPQDKVRREPCVQFEDQGCCEQVDTVVGCDAGEELYHDGQATRVAVLRACGTLQEWLYWLDFGNSFTTNDVITMMIQNSSNE